MNNNLKNWIKVGLDKGLSDIQIKLVKSNSLNLSVYEGEVEKNEISYQTIALVKGIYNGKAVNAKLEDLSLENFSHVIDRLIDNAKNITANEPALIFEGSEKYEEVVNKEFDFSLIKPEEKVSMLLEIEKGIKANEFCTKVDTVYYGENTSETTIVNSKGLNLFRSSKFLQIYASAVYEKDGQVKTGLSYKILNDNNDLNIKDLIDENIKLGTGQLGAKSIKSGKYPVVFSNEEFGNILSVFEGIFTGEAAFRNLTKLIGKENTKIGSSKVNLVDNPFHDKALFKVSFDDEGVACSKRYWIENGVFKGFVHNLKTAAIFNTAPTGNGFGGISAANLVLESEDISLDEVFKTINEGIYITDLVGLHAISETVSGNFSLEASGFVIKDGKIERPVDSIVVSGNFFELLSNLEYVANDFKFGLSGIGTGSVKIKELTIAGE